MYIILFLLLNKVHYYSTSLVRLKVWGTSDQMEVCLDDNGLLRRGQIIWRKLYQLVRYMVTCGSQPVFF